MKDRVGRSDKDDQYHLDEEFLTDTRVLAFNPFSTGVQTIEQLKKHPRVMPPGCVEELYQVYSYSSQKDSTNPPASLATFRREFYDWNKVLLFQRPSEHAVCSQCGKYAELRKQAKTQEQKDNVSENHANHLIDMFADRDMEAFLHRLSIEGTRSRTRTPSDSSVVLVRLDGMDQAKFRCPRHTSMMATKEMEKLAGLIAHCLCDCLWCVRMLLCP